MTAAPLITPAEWQAAQARLDAAPDGGTATPAPAATPLHRALWRQMP